MDEDPRIELASVKAQLNAIQKAIEEMKSGISAIASVDKTVLEIKLRLETNEEKLADAMKRVDILEKQQDESAAYLNKIKGFAVIMSLAQALIVSGSGWLLSTVIDTSESVSVIQESVVRLSAEQTRIRDLIESYRR